VVGSFSVGCCPSNSSLMLVDLQDGDLVHGENFSLFAAMSALEVRTTLFPPALLVCLDAFLSIVYTAERVSK
jgi:hypothetical protein